MRERAPMRKRLMSARRVIQMYERRKASFLGGCGAKLRLFLKELGVLASI
jgi:hypothetical protein